MYFQVAKKSNIWHQGKYISSVEGVDKRCLRRKILKELAFEYLFLRQDYKCYRCQEPIDAAMDLHLDHTEDWHNAKDVLSAYLDTTAIALSHARCNMLHGRQKGGLNSRKSCKAKKSQVSKPSDK